MCPTESPAASQILFRSRWPCSNAVMEETFRRATTQDWERIWPIFETVVRDGDTYPYLPDTDEETARGLWMSDDVVRRTTFVAERDGAVIATSYVKPNAVGLMNHIANSGWMVAPSERSQGVGRRFAQWTLAQAKTLGFTHMQLNAVVETNEPSMKLCTSLGFEIIGTLPDAFRHTTLGPTPVHIMYRAL